MAEKRIKTNTEILANGKLEGLNYKSENVVALITNKAFKSDLQSYLKTEQDGKKAAWKLVRLLGKMSGEIKQDFGSDYAFADFMGMSQSVVNKKKRLAEYAIELENQGYTDSNAYEFLPLIKKLEALETHEKKLEAFREILKMFSPDMTQKELRETVKNIEIEIDDNKTAKIEQKEAETENEDTAEKEELQKQENVETDNALLPLELNEMYEITIPAVENVEGTDYATYYTYQVSGEVFKVLAQAIEDIIGKDVE